MITSWERFKTGFGDFQEGNATLAHALFGFFNNGGTRCWVTRIADEINPENVRVALETLKPIDEIAIVVVPGAVSDEVQNAILDHCEDTYLQDRFAILDGRHEEVTNFNLTKEAIQGGTRDSSYGAIYFPWIEVFDPITDKNIYVPPSGYIAGVYSRVDTERGVHKAPANEVIRGAEGVEIDVTKADQAGLNPDGINVIRKFSGNNILIWGARTLASKEDPEWQYINVRRLFLYLRESIDEGTQWAVFEPNDFKLWAKIRRNVSAFLTNVWHDGALFGKTPQEAFYVKCDEETNPPEVRDLGQVVTEIGVAVVKPAEFVIFRISQWAGPKANG
ncbi:MAG: phage tail sheath subtilisin-like domain-containing protein [Nostoc sp.]|uniref:phage tail sheath family protein n=1 Tax=Nostoc sp. TaxID=1180 RepID=UPI002FF5B39B